MTRAKSRVTTAGEVIARRNLLPTWKWWTGTTTAAGAIATAAFTGDGINTDQEKILVIGLIVQRVVTYLTPNMGDDANGTTRV